jgi:hypothetical protein
MSGMGSTKGGHNPASPEERQAAATVASARTVVAEIDLLRQRLSDASLPVERRRQAKYDLAEASDRLCNLMALAVYQLTNGVHGQFQDRLRSILDGLRNRLLEMSTRLMLEKVQRIHDRAGDVLEGGAYPLGLATRLNQAFSSIVSNLTTLGAFERLSEKERTLIEQTTTDIRSLAAIESRLGVLDEIGNDDPKVRNRRR